MTATVDISFLGKTPTERLLRMMERLRDPESGCAWDIEQTFATIAPYTIEEAYEVSDAIDRGNMDDLREELGDLLLQVVFHAQMANEGNLFDFGEVADGLVMKMVRRHPHVFGTADTRTAEMQSQAWETLKAQERAQKSKDKPASLLDDVALALPALMRAEKLQKRAARAGFDWPDAGPVVEKITEEAQEIVEAANAQEPQSRIEEEVGDFLFAAVNLARKLGVDPEAALRRGNHKFTRRFQHIENEGAASGQPIQDMSLEDMEALWNAAKARGL